MCRAHEFLEYGLQLVGFLVVVAVIIIDLYLTRLVSMTYKKLGEKYYLEKVLESVQLRQEIRALQDTLRKFEKRKDL
ncbi:MAG: hypothetical protein M3044_19770 [Thermoproteota archaeon]|nr:hypothetical protein [Thermoproteota archaeon]